MAIEPYQRAIAVQDKQGSSTALPEIVDGGAAFSGLGRSLLAAADPILERKAEKEAVEAAGVATVAKDENGNFIRPPAPVGRGTAFVDTYDKVMNDRYANAVVKGAEETFDTMAAAHRNDPEGLLAAMHGHAIGLLKAVDPQVRASVDTALAREISERHRGVSQLKAANDWQALTNGLRDDINSHHRAALAILASGGDTKDVTARAQVEFDAAMKSAGQLEQLGETSALSTGATARDMTSAFVRPLELRTSQDNAKVFGPMMATLSDEQLATVGYWGKGLVNPKIKSIAGGIDIDGFQHMFPDEGFRSGIATAADKMLSDRQAAQRAAAADAAATAQLKTTQQMLTELRARDIDPQGGNSPEEVLAVETELLGGQNTNQVMSTPEGRQRVLAGIANYGIWPPKVTDYIESHLVSGQTDAINDFMQNAMSLYHKGNAVGLNLMKKLSPTAQGMYNFDAAMRRSGIPDPVRRARLEEAYRGAMPTSEEVSRAYVPQRQGDPGYAARRDAALATALHTNVPAVQASVRVSRDFDALLRVNFKLYKGDPERAMTETAKQVSGAFMAHPIYVGGVGPRRLVTAGYAVPDLDKAILSDRTKNPTGASFNGGAGGTARLQPISDDPGEHFGNYVVHIFSPTGREINAFPIDMDKALVPAREAAVTRRAAEATRARAAAWNQLPEFGPGRDPRNGSMHPNLPKQLRDDAPPGARDAFLRQNPGWRP